MKYIFSILIVAVFFNCNSESPKKSISTLLTFKDSTSYSLGADLGDNLKEAQAKAYNLVDQVSFEGAFFRKDIGFKGIK